MTDITDAMRLIHERREAENKQIVAAILNARLVLAEATETRVYDLAEPVNVTGMAMVNATGMQLRQVEVSRTTFTDGSESYLTARGAGHPLKADGTPDKRRSAGWYSLSDALASALFDERTPRRGAE